MYEEYWGLRASPFRGGATTDMFFGTANHEEALARLSFLVEQRRPLGLLIGEPGIGKSRLLQVFAEQLADTTAAPARLNPMCLDLQGMLWTLAAEWDLNPAASTDSFRLWHDLTDRLVALRYENRQPVLLLDDAERASPAIFDALLRLFQLDPHPDRRLTVVLAMDSGRLGQLPRTFLDLAELTVSLDPWEEPDTAAYLNIALSRAGREEPVFTASAARRLHELTGGVPRRIRHLADLALVAGAGLLLGEITLGTIDDVCQELAGVQVDTISSASR